MISSYFKYVTILVTGLGYLTPLHALPPPSGTALPGQIEKQFQSDPQIRKHTGGVTTPSPSAHKIPEGADEIRFVLTDIELDGFSVYSQKRVQSFYSQLINREIELQDIYDLADRLTAIYRTDGYILSQVIVPEQSIDSGRVRLQAIEGFISEVKLVGEQNDSERLIAAYAKKIKSRRPLTAHALERYMLLINDLPGVYAQATLAPSPTDFGAADLTIHYTRNVYSTGVSVDNKGGEALGTWRTKFDLQLENVLGLNERTALLAVKSPASELAFVSIEHEEQLGSEGTKVKIGYSKVQAKPEDLSAIPLELYTDSDSAALTLLYPLIRSRSSNLYLRASLTGHDSKTQMNGLDLSEDHLRVVRIAASYDMVDRFKATNLLDIEYSHGIKGMGSSENGDPILSRAGGKVDFEKLNIYMARLQPLNNQWSVLLAAAGQYAYDDLLSPELFSYGGETFGRGYDPSEKVGDHGLAAKLEVRYSKRLAFRKPLPYTVYSYYDTGTVWQRTTSIYDDDTPTDSAGIGVRVKFSRNISGSLELAKPITKDVVASGDRENRGYFGLTARF